MVNLMKLLAVLVNINFCLSIVVHEEEIVVRLLGGDKVARDLANELGFIYNGPVSFCCFFHVLSVKILYCLNTSLNVIKFS